jgi:hypothetical protein
VFGTILEAFTVFGTILESSRLPLTVPWALHGSGKNGARVGSWRGCLVRSLLDGDEVDRLASPLHRPTMLSCLPRGQGLSVRRRLVLSR